MDGPQPPPEKGRPPEPESLAAHGLGVSEAAELGARLKRYGTAKARSRAMAGYLCGVASDAPTYQARDLRRLSHRLYECGSHLLFRHYFEHAKTQLIRSSSCQVHMLCPLCAIRRAARMLRRYHELLSYLAPRFDLYLVTLTVKNGDDLAERFAHLRGSIQRLRKRAAKGYGALAPMAGALWSFELTKSEHGWHPHAHGVVVMPKGHPPIRWGEGSQLRLDWEGVTGDSFIVHAAPIEGEGTGLVESLAEVLKYALKFSGLDLADNWAAYKVLKGARLISSWGVLFGLHIPEDLALDDPELDGPYIEWLFRYGSTGYRLEKGPTRSPGALPSAPQEVPTDGSTQETERGSQGHVDARAARALARSGRPARAGTGDLRIHGRLDVDGPAVPIAWSG